MKELAILKKEPRLQIKSQKEVMTAGVKIVEFNLISEGTPHTVYSPINSDVILDGLLKNIKDDKSLAKNPSFAYYIKSIMNKTPEEYVTETSLEYIETLKAKKNVSNFRDNLLDTFIKQEALKQLFKAAEKSQK